MNSGKKKIILLTVIGFLTLMTVVISATFAYFNATGTNRTTSSELTTTAEDVGFVTLSGGNTMHIRLAANDMANDKIGRSYFATASDENYATIREDIEVAKATVVGGNDTTTYNCTFDLNAILEGTMVDSLKYADAKIVYSGIFSLEEDLTDITTTRSVNVSLTGKDATSSVNAYVVFNNTTMNQSYVAGKSLNIKITAENFSCDIGESGSKELSEEAKALAATIAATEVGDSFGAYTYYEDDYSQSNNYIVLAKETDKALVLYSSSGGGGGYGYSSVFDANGNVDWKDSSIRTNLNTKFINERKELNELVIESTVYTRSSSDINEFYTTKDKVFILSEADRLGTLQGQAITYADNPLDFSIAPDEDGNILPDTVTVTGSGIRLEYDYMWLRTPGVTDGTVRYASTRYGGTHGEDVPTNEAVVYPIMWVDISSAS